MDAARCRIGSDLSGVLPPRAWEPLDFHNGRAKVAGKN